MLAAILNSVTAVKASLAVVDAFVYLRGLLGTHKELARKLRELALMPSESSWNQRQATKSNASKDSHRNRAGLDRGRPLLLLYDIRGHVMNTILITGANKGLGFETARRLALGTRSTSARAIASAARTLRID